MSTNINTVKQLRAETGAGVSDCHKALEACKGDIEEAKLWLRKEGIAKAVKKQDRKTAKGLITSYAKGGFGALLELNCETDFVARNERFQEFVTALLKDVADHQVASLEAFLAHEALNVQERILEQSGVLGEHIRCSRLGVLETNPGVVCSYVHWESCPNMGPIGALVALDSELPEEILKPLGEGIAMHVVASSPLYKSVDDVPKEDIAREESIYRDQLKDSNKPAPIIEKMISGRVKSFLEETVLEEQKFVKDLSRSVKVQIQELEKEHGKSIRISSFLRFVLGADA
ncbi:MULTISPECIES: translation elongation factor Ts [Holospora]|uniref:Elongation factor Ts n=2 Tax=Holospora TaxID=44747 RepID=A0A061JI21_9PROT|nr:MULTISPECIES: translation elongation factor Ts [Holospora]ETZ04624.1 elongation factor Ts [Holospora undulata HU1]GAJ46063.1 elongation factor Ts [Holospora elegans E1]